MKVKMNVFKRIFNLFSILIFVVIVAVIGFYYYFFSIPQLLGRNAPSSPEQIVRNVSLLINDRNGEITINQAASQRLAIEGLWIQILDEAGREIISYNKPSEIPTSYLANQLIDINIDTNNSINDNYTIFAQSMQLSGKTITYLVGFPYRIGRFMLIYNGERGERMLQIVSSMIVFATFALFLVICGYVFWLTKHLARLVKGINDISLRNHQPLGEVGAFSEIYRSINLLHTHISKSDEVQIETERLRQEWIANITHDLKTPLSSIKGYAELFSTHADLEVQNSSKTIARNVEYTELFINDMKLIYQLESNSLPYAPQPVKIVRYLKETTIDIINHPLFANRKLEFESQVAPAVEVMMDANLFYRAVQNLIINALIHNSSDTTVKVSIETNALNYLQIKIQDDGVGMDANTCLRLFDRYYRGTNTKQQTEGSGLGMAIAKQIVELHQGNLSVDSEINVGTTIFLTFPDQNKT